MSESLILGALLALAGGCMDAYSYLCRGGVFANAQTGNILLLGVRLSEGDWAAAGRYLCPVLAFTAGIAVAEGIRFRLEARSRLHWRQAAVLAECVILTAVSFFPLTMNLAANSLTSFACGIQAESFRKIRGSGAATTMCIGNLRSGTEALCSFRRTGDRAALERGALFFGLIACFVLGAVLGNFCVGELGRRAILCAAGFLLAAFAAMFARPDGQARSAGERP
jgi:uncharacterized membrane protein YoaK (UPF0700 family)